MKTISRNEVEDILMQQHYVKLRYTGSGVEWGERWLSGEQYVLKTIPIGLPSSLLEIRAGDVTHSAGPIIIDINKNRIPYEFVTNNKVPGIIVIDGNHRLKECIEQGHDTIDAFVSDAITSW